MYIEVKVASIDAAKEVTNALKGQIANEIEVVLKAVNSMKVVVKDCTSVTKVVVGT